jgi:hypothetical protein
LYEDLLLLRAIGLAATPRFWFCTRLHALHRYRWCRSPERHHPRQWQATTSHPRWGTLFDCSPPRALVPSVARLEGPRVAQQERIHRDIGAALRPRAERRGESAPAHDSVHLIDPLLRLAIAHEEKVHVPGLAHPCVLEWWPQARDWRAHHAQRAAESIRHQ